MTDVRGAGNHRLSGTFGTATGLTASWTLPTNHLPLIGVEVGTAWQNADIWLMVSTDDATYFPMFDNGGTPVKIAGTAGWLAQGVYWFGAGAVPVGCYPYFKFKTVGAGAGTAFLPTSAETVYAILVY